MLLRPYKFYQMVKVLFLDTNLFDYLLSLIGIRNVPDKVMLQRIKCAEQTSWV